MTIFRHVLCRVLNTLDINDKPIAEGDRGTKSSAYMLYLSCSQLLYNLAYHPCRHRQDQERSTFANTKTTGYDVYHLIYYYSVCNFYFQLHRISTFMQESSYRSIKKTVSQLNQTSTKTLLRPWSMQPL